MSRNCYFCGVALTRKGTKRPTSATWEHLTPKSKGGTNDASNRVRACFKCNQAKGDKTEPEYREYLRCMRLLRNHKSLIERFTPDELRSGATAEAQTPGSVLCGKVTH